MGKNQVYDIRELLDIQMKTRRKHVAKVEEEKTEVKEERKLSVGGSSVSWPSRVLLIICCFS